MAKQIKYSKRALAERRKILEYWIARNKSTAYSKKLFQMFSEAINSIQNFPSLGSATNKKNVRFLVVRDYRIFFKITEEYIFILGFWDTRRDPDKAKH